MCCARVSGIRVRSGLLSGKPPGLVETMHLSEARHRERHSSTKTDASASQPLESADTPLLPSVLTCVAAACCGAFAFGYHLAVVNGPLSTMAVDLGFAGNKALEGLVVSSTLGGAAIGSLTGGTMSDVLGRRRAFLTAVLPLISGPLLIATAHTFNQAALGRFVTGLAIGLTSAVVPTYISEVAPSKLRGTLGALNQLTICLGILAALLANVLLPATQWRTMFLAALAPAALLFLGMLASPESPRWLAQNGRQAEASAAATKLWGASGPAQVATAAGGDGAGGQGSWAEALSAKYRGPFIAGCMLFLFQQFAGINAIVYFSSSVFRQAGITSDALASAAVGATNVLGTVVAASFIERTGRVTLIANSFMGQAVAMAAMALAFSLESLKPYAGPIAFGGTLFYILSFALGAGPVPALIIPEMNGARVRGRAMSAAMVTHWIANVVVGQTFMGAVDQYGLAAVYGFFGVTAALASVYARRALKETKGKTLEQIESELV